MGRVRDRDRDHDRTGHRRSLGTENALMSSSPVPLSFPSGKGPAKGQNGLVGTLALEVGRERAVSVWREDVARNAGGAALEAAAVMALLVRGAATWVSDVRRSRVSTGERG